MSGKRNDPVCGPLAVIKAGLFFAQLMKPGGTYFNFKKNFIFDFKLK